MVATVEERLERLEERVGELEADARRPRIGMTVEEAKAALNEPDERGPDELARLRRIFNRFDGPGDLSEHMRDYLYGNRA